jgi:predicted component of type VI protein secretion system
MARLIFEHNRQVLKDYPFRKGGMTIGRNSDNTIVIRSPEISAYHARIDKRGVDYILTDLQSTNGTSVNGMNVISHRLTHGDRISFGKYDFLFIGTERAKAEVQEKKLNLNQTMIVGGSKKKEVPLEQEPLQRRATISQVERQGSPRSSAPVLMALFILVVGGAYLLSHTPSLIEWVPTFVASSPRSQPESRTEARPTLDMGTDGQGWAARTEARPAKPLPLPAEPALYEKEVSANRSAEEPVPSARESWQDLENSLGELSEGLGSSDLRLEGIVWANNAEHSFAVINGFVVRSGKTIAGLRVTEIGRRYVILQSAEGDSELRLTLR